MTLDGKQGNDARAKRDFSLGVLVTGYLDKRSQGWTGPVWKPRYVLLSPLLVYWEVSSILNQSRFWVLTKDSIHQVRPSPLLSVRCYWFAAVQTRPEGYEFVRSGTAWRGSKRIGVRVIIAIKSPRNAASHFWSHSVTCMSCLRTRAVSPSRTPDPVRVESRHFTLFTHITVPFPSRQGVSFASTRPV